MAIENGVTEDDIIEPPLVVDFDGTLVRSDVLVEAVFAHLGVNPLGIINLLIQLARGRAAFKAHLAEDTAIDVRHLPYDTRVLALIEEAQQNGRKVYLASASNERYVSEVARHLGVEGWFASDGSVNLSSHSKASRLVDAFGENGFDYVGNDRADLPVWAVSRRCFAVHPSGSVRRELTSIDAQAQVIESQGGQAIAWIKLIRVHQWAKNALVFVPLLTAQKFDLGSLTSAVAAFFAFSLAASAVYILNDLVDIDADRKHPSKKRRPLATGAVPIRSAIPACLILLLSAFRVTLAASPLFAGVLLGYLALTTAYTFFLKRKMLVDVIVLASLCTTRVILAGRDAGRLSAIAQDLRFRGGIVDTLAVDLAGGKPEADFAEMVSKLGGVDAVLLAYGVLGEQALAETNAQDAERILQTDFTSAAVWCLAAANVLEKQNHGALVVIGSVAGDRGRASNYVYGAAKGGLGILVQGIAHRLARSGARAVLIKPGFVDTPMTAHIGNKGALWAKPEVIAKYILKAADSSQRVGPIIYAPPFWRWIMYVIRSVPSPIFHRTKL